MCSEINEAIRAPAHMGVWSVFYFCWTWLPFLAIISSLYLQMSGFNQQATEGFAYLKIWLIRSFGQRIA